jgi:hypothetical protein
VFDEFSAVNGAVPAAINLAERVRDVGVSMMFAAQSFQGLGGNELEAHRLLAACAGAGGIILHRCPDPDRLLSAAGTVRAGEMSW